MGRRFSYGPQGPGLDLQQCNKEGRESEGGCRVDGGESSLEEEEEETEKDGGAEKKGAPCLDSSCCAQSGFSRHGDDAGLSSFLSDTELGRGV